MAGTTLRKDAARNRQRLIDAGREVFAARGFEATLNDVAHHAGVGVGTAYRRFANKEELADAIFEDQVGELEAILHEALAMDDAWEALVQYMERALAMQVRDRAMAQILSGSRVTDEQHDWSRDQLAPLVDAVADRAREQGALRPGVRGTDLIFAQMGIVAIAGRVGDGAPELYRRYLGITLDGLRADSVARVEPPVPALTTEETHALLHAQR